MSQSDNMKTVQNNLLSALAKKGVSQVNQGRKIAMIDSVVKTMMQGFEIENATLAYIDAYIREHE